MFSELYLADVAGAIFNSALICGTMLPLAVYCGKILLQVGSRPYILCYCVDISPVQTAPEHVLPLLDKSLREVHTCTPPCMLINTSHVWPGVCLGWCTGTKERTLLDNSLR